MERKVRVVEVTESYCQEVDELGPASSLDEAIRLVRDAGYEIKVDFDVNCPELLSDERDYVVTVFPLPHTIDK